VGAFIRRDAHAAGLRTAGRIGLLGGSFNPAHDGHRHLSETALRALGLDAVWWLVSPGNPLKDAADNAPLAERVSAARAIAAGQPRIQVTDIEAALGTRYTVDTLERLAACFPEARFVWLMGADNLSQIDRWKGWQRIFGLVPVAIFDRAPYSFRAMAAKAAHRFARYQQHGAHARRLAHCEPPAWSFFHARLHPASATAIRARRDANGLSTSKRRER
jgi:nicotinate-nucleotide adenylyltransferase